MLNLRQVIIERGYVAGSSFILQRPSLFSFFLENKGEEERKNSPLIYLVTLSLVLV